MPSATSSNYLYDAQINFLLQGTSWTPPTSIFIALFTVVPALDGTGGTEVSDSGTNYARVEVSQGDWSAPTGVNRQCTNSNDIQFGTPSANWGTIAGMGLYDSAIGGDNNLLYTATLTTPKVVNNGDGAPKILSGQLRINRATCA